VVALMPRFLRVSATGDVPNGTSYANLGN
jgi:hypothetical protein